MKTRLGTSVNQGTDSKKINIGLGFVFYTMLLYSSADTSTGWLQVQLTGNSEHKAPSGVEVSAPLEIKDNATQYRQRIYVSSLCL